MAWRGWSLCVLAAVGCAGPLTAQSTSGRDLAAGKFLVASRGLLDPNFSETVVLLVHYQDDGAMGLVVNRRTKTAISRVLSGDEAKGRADPIYIGGPVETTLVTALARSSADLAGAERIFGDVYAISARALLSKSLASPIAASAFHAYLGYAGWSAPQLRHEMELGSWYIFPGDAGTVFDADPGSVWNRLIERTDTRIATIAHPPYAPR